MSVLLSDILAGDLSRATERILAIFSSTFIPCYDGSADCWRLGSDACIRILTTSVEMWATYSKKKCYAYLEACIDISLFLDISNISFTSLSDTRLISVLRQSAISLIEGR